MYQIVTLRNNRKIHEINAIFTNNTKSTRICGELRISLKSSRKGKLRAIKKAAEATFLREVLITSHDLRIHQYECQL